jgi:enoyl-[acyl-carrier protein] reductase I
MILEGKRLLITGVSDRNSIALAIAREAQGQGAELILTSFGRMRRITEMTAKKLDPVPDILELDVNKPEDIVAVRDDLRRRWGGLDGVLHSVAYAPPDALGGNFLNTPWESAATALQTSAFSLKELAAGLLPLLQDRGASIVTLDFDNSTQAWPKYDWMGVSKAALEAVVRYLARDLGRYRVRVNALCAGPLLTLAAKGIPGFREFEEVWGDRAPLGWDINDRTAVAKTACVMLSDWLPATTGELVHVDGGYHAMGAELPPENTAG